MLNDKHIDAPMLGRFLMQYDEGAAGFFVDADEAQEVAQQVKLALTMLDVADMPKLFSAFRTTVSRGGAYEMVFRFANMEDMHAADDEWHDFRAALSERPVPCHAETDRSSATAKAIDDGAAEVVPPDAGEVKRLTERLDDLQRAEAEYRRMHDLHGDDSMWAGHAWDLMRRAGDKARAALGECSK